MFLKLLLILLTQGCGNTLGTICGCPYFQMYCHIIYFQLSQVWTFGMVVQCDAVWAQISPSSLDLAVTQTLDSDETGRTCCMYKVYLETLVNSSDSREVGTHLEQSVDALIIKCTVILFIFSWDKLKPLGCLCNVRPYELKFLHQALTLQLLECWTQMKLGGQVVCTKST